jgi:TBCC domain-containing protein 1
VGTFLLLHCEEFAYQRNLSGLDDRRFYGATTGQSDARTEPLRNTANVDFATLFKHPSLSPRTRLHAGWNNDNSHCTAYLLRHLRKILLLAAIPHNQDAVNACVHLAALPSPPPTLSAERLRHSSTNARPKYSPDELRRQHDEEHGQVGSNVKLTLDDLERLHLLLQLPHGGAFEDSPIQIGEFLWTSLKMASPPPMATIPLGDVEEEIRQHLEMELFMAGRGDGNKHGVSADEEETAHSALAKLSLSGTKGGGSGDTSDRATQPDNVYQKELSYVHLRGKTIVLKPNPPEPVSGASVTSHEPHATSNFASPSRLHDLVISECSDAHFYLLQPFEHATIAACTGCTIVVGAVAGLLHIVDCEKTSITSAARRLLVSNSSDVQMCVFTPSPPLLVGDNRSCQFAPYNTYYDGFREDLLATGLAAAVVPEHQSPYHGSGGRNYTDTDGSWPPLQCASNKWKHPVELARLEMPQIPPTPPGPSNTSIGGVASAGADDKAMGKSGTGNDTSVHAPVLVPASEFHILFVPIESDASKQRRLEADENDRSSEPGRLESQYCRLLSELLQTSPFRLPMEYERRVLVKVDRMKTIQQSVQKNLTTEQQAKFEEELNRGFRDWLVTSGNLRQVLDLVHLERRGGV